MIITFIVRVGSALCDLSSSLNPAGRGVHGWSCQGSTPTTNLCSWGGVHCVSGVVTRLLLPNWKLAGSLPSSIGQLLELTYLNMSGNSIRGTLPSSFRTLTKLINLDLSMNSLSGSIPTNFISLSGISYLSLAGNNLLAQIPTLFGNFSQILSLNLYSNKFTGSLPSVIVSLSSLSYLNIASTSMTGSLPSSLCSMSLQSLSFFGTKITCYDTCLHTIAYTYPGSVPICYQSKFYSYYFLKSNLTLYSCYRRCGNLRPRLFFEPCKSQSVWLGLYFKCSFYQRLFVVWCQLCKWRRRRRVNLQHISVWFDSYKHRNALEFDWYYFEWRFSGGDTPFIFREPSKVKAAGSTVQFIDRDAAIYHQLYEFFDCIICRLEFYIWNHP